MSHEGNEDHDALYARIANDIARERGPIAFLRALRTEVRVGLVVVAAIVGSGLILHFMVHYEPAMPSLLTMAGLLALFLTATILATWPMYRRGLSRHLKWAGVVVTLGAGLGLILLDSAPIPSELGNGHCVIAGGLAGLPAFVTALLVMRRPWDGVVFAGAAGGITSAINVQLFCGGAPWAHSLTEHFGIFAGFIVAAALLTAILDAAKRRRPARS